jgi:4-amino-4-deoxy-L-arabinose transferase-like glycosyltransferase
MLGRGLGLIRPSGEFVPSISHPPLYPILLSLLGGSTHNVIAAAHWLDVVAFGVLITLSGILFARVLRSKWLAVALAGVLLVNPAIVLAYISAMAEPVFLLTGLVGLLLLLIYLDSHKARFLILSAVAIGLAFLTRYAGAAFVATGIIVLLALNPASRRKRVADASLLGIISIAPVAMFVIWFSSVLGAPPFRVLRLPSSAGDLLIQFLRQIPPVLWSWKPFATEVLSLTPGQATILSTTVAVGAFVLLAAFGILSLRAIRRSSRNDTQKIDLGHVWRLMKGLIVFEVAFLVVFAASYVFTSPTPDVDSRTLLPVLPVLIMILLVALYAVFQLASGNQWIRLLSGAIILFSITGYALISAEMVIGMHRTGAGYTSRRWTESETIAAVRRLPSGIPLISNEPMPILLHADQWPYGIEELSRQEPLSVFTRYGDGDGEDQKLFREEGAALVLFDSAFDQFSSLYPQQSQVRLEALIDGLSEFSEGNDGAIYFYPQP